MPSIDSVNVIGSRISMVTRSAALASIKDSLAHSSGSYSCFVNAHVTVEARHNRALREAVNGATFAFPDGMPVFLAGRLLSRGDMHKISGPDFFEWVFSSTELRTCRHYFFGSTPETLEKLINNLQERYPGCNIVGWESPPFRPVTDAELANSIARMAQARAEVIWIGLGAPKQEIWMSNNFSKLPNTLLLGVGAAFDFHAGVIKRAPVWAQKTGLEWLYRVIQEPRRLWKRYLVTNTLFIYYFMIGLVSRSGKRGREA